MTRTYAVATVVGRTAPVSSHLGDRAIVHADGTMEGFIGGSCSREIVRKQALAAIRAGEPRLVRIRPDAPVLHETRDVITVPMGCISEGAVDVFIEPHLPKRQLLLAGFTPVAHALAQLAPLLDFEVVRFVHEQERAETGAQPVDLLAAYLQGLDPEIRERSAAVAASQGHYDEAALTAFLAHDLAYVGFLASRKRASAILDLLAAEGVSAHRLAAVHNPAGLAIGARKPVEVAISILAEMIAGFSANAPAQTTPQAETATDPVCGMEVEITASAPHAESGERTYYFCSPHCRAAFAATAPS